MKINPRKGKGGVFPVIAGLLISVAALPWLGRTSPAPGLSISLSTNNGVLLTVTNATNNEFYEIYSTNSILNTMAWSLHSTGAIGQSNFYIQMFPAVHSFFKARAGSDWDADGVQNYRDANPNNAAIGVLTVTIESPTNGSSIQ